MGTFTLKAAYCNGETQIFEDSEGIFHHKGIQFQIKDEKFLSDQLIFELPKKTEISVFERVALSLGMPLSKQDSKSELDAGKVPFRELLHVLTMMALKDHKLISNGFSYRKQHSYGKNVFEVYYASVSGSGKIKAEHKNLRWLNEQDTKQLKSKLFETSDYKPGVHSMKYEPTEVAENLMTAVFEFMKLLKFKKSTIEGQVLDFVVTMNDLQKIRLRDVMLLLADCIWYDNGFIIRPRLEDRQYSRVYSIFTSISSDTRKILGFTNYDIGAALQTICLQLVEDPSVYPLHQHLVADKTAFRAKVKKETGNDAAWVKKELSKTDNLDNMPKRYENYPTLKAYFEEAPALRKELIASAEPLIRSRANDFAKPKWEPFWNPVKNEFEYIIVGKKETSIFFFIWTQWERQIRESMMSCFDDPSACH